ncbi:CobW family GTP-binding protein [Sodalis sp. RH21]|uniref:CobW family GTP-binding protein n=1 Tax=unclassified Sodalis (in: enterobacteria) TaxID=2636512 RepID=UPI0039B377AE
MIAKTTLVTGFLGSGKTTTLLHLLAQKPAGERWAVLVNEFGEIGVDGALLAESGAVLKEIPGGCMCCVNGLPMQIGLNTLLQRSAPDRLLIEPTGLGHPKQILSLLTSPIYESWLSLQATLCLLDARQLGDPRCRDNENFRDQLAAADIIIANKQDRYAPEDRALLAAWEREYGGGRSLIPATRGEIDLSLLDAPRLNLRELPAGRHHHRHDAPGAGLAALRLPSNTGWRRALNQGQGYHASGWIFDGDTLFDTVGVLEWARLAPVERVKGVMRIAEGTLLVNRQGQDLQIETRPAPPPDSRIELINPAPADWNALQSSLLRIRLCLPD